MSQFPKQPKKIRERITRYERELRREYDTYKFIDDSSGKRYLLGPLYLLAGDLAGAIRSFEWFEQTFPDDMGEPAHLLCWALALCRSGNIAGASRKLLHAMLSNLYMIPHLLGLEQNRLDIWHSSNFADIDYLQYVPPEIWTLWDQAALQWAHETYDRPEFCQVRTRYIEIFAQLASEPRGPRRSRLVEEAFELRATELERPSVAIIDEIATVVQEACARDTNIFGYGIWTHHITQVVENGKRLAELFGADQEIVEIAALLHDYASIKDQALYPDHHVHSPLEAEKLLKRLGYPQARIEAVKECIAAHRGSVPGERRSAEAECLANADAMTHIEQVPSLLELAFVQRKMGIDEGTRWVRSKLERSWNKLSPRIQDMMRARYEAAIQVLAVGNNAA
jgi:uncharacterized protein